mgnify:CR=1 FL=1
MIRARLRPGTNLAEGARVGNFVETKKADIGVGSKVNHLSYIGDTEIGEGVNIGAGTITCNYDGANKHRTVIGDNAFIGSNTQIVAPVTIEEGATIGARSDLYSFGIVLYEMLTGRLPFRGEGDQAVLHSILHEDPRPVTELRSDLPRDVARLVKHCLEKEPRKRLQTTLDLANELEELRREVDSGEALTSGGAPIATRRAGGKRRVWLVSGAVVAALVAGAVDGPDEDDLARVLRARGQLPGAGRVVAEVIVRMTFSSVSRSVSPTGVMVTSAVLDPSGIETVPLPALNVKPGSVLSTVKSVVSVALPATSKLTGTSDPVAASLIVKV